MIEHNLFLISMVTLLICLCMGSLVALPTDNLAGMSGLEIFGIEIENDNRFEHAVYGCCVLLPCSIGLAFLVLRAWIG